MPAHSDRETGIRFGIGARPGSRGRERSDAITPSSRPNTCSCASGTGSGGPVVPDVSWMRATEPG